MAKVEGSNPFIRFEHDGERQAHSARARLIALVQERHVGLWRLRAGPEVVQYPVL